MADRITVSGDWLSHCASVLNDVADALETTASRLGAIDLDSECGGQLRVRCNLRLRNNTVQGSTARDAAAAMRRALKSLREQSTGLSRNVAGADNSFSDAEKAILQYLSALGERGAAASDVPAIGTLNELNVFGNRVLDSISRVSQSFTSIYDDYKARRAERERIRRETADSAIVYDESKHNIQQYGGNQSSPKTKTSEFDIYRNALLENRGVRLNDKRLGKYLEKLETMGCPYVALTNVVFKQYEGNSEAFEADFGFPMYKNNALNYDRMIVEFYTKADNLTAVNNGVPTYNTQEDYQGLMKDGIILGYNEFNDNDDRGIPANSTFEMRLNYCLDGAGTVTRLDNSAVTVENYESISRNGDIIVSIAGNNARIYDLQGNAINIGGHCMSITGVENNRFVVSSWGQKYYFDPSDNPATLIYDQITFNP